MSGAGKSTALKILEDAGYFCVDNLPIPLLEKFAQFIVEGNSGSIQKVALGVDVRSGGGMEEMCIRDRIESAVYTRDLTDIVDILQEMLKTEKKDRKE